MTGQYLAETAACNHTHPAIQKILASILAGVEGPVDEVERARRIFFHARDAIHFALLGSGSTFTAAKTAATGYGDCGSKTNYQMALLRAAGIPARMRGIKADFSVLKGVIPGWISYLSERFYPEDFHFWPECCLNSRWLSCEGLFDKPLYEGALRAGLISRDQIPAIDWDGETSLVLLGPWTTQDLGHKPGWQEWQVEFKKAMPTPGWLDRLLDCYLAPACRRKSDSVRGHA
jgi:hypothetical protein